jgi:hypothetical protein
MCHLAYVLISCRLPSPVYSIYLKEHKYFLQLRALAIDNPSYIATTDQFLQLYFNSEEDDKNLLCELYQHNLVLSELHDWDPNPHVGDIQLRHLLPL